MKEVVQCCVLFMRPSERASIVLISASAELILGALQRQMVQKKWESVTLHWLGHAVRILRRRGTYSPYNNLIEYQDTHFHPWCFYSVFHLKSPIGIGTPLSCSGRIHYTCAACFPSPVLYLAKFFAYITTGYILVEEHEHISSPLCNLTIASPMVA